MVELKLKYEGLGTPNPSLAISGDEAVITYYFDATFSDAALKVICHSGEARGHGVGIGIPIPDTEEFNAAFKAFEKMLLNEASAKEKPRKEEPVRGEKITPAGGWVSE